VGQSSFFGKKWFAGGKRKEKKALFMYGRKAKKSRPGSSDEEMG